MSSIPETLRALSAVQASIAAEYAEAPMKAAVHDEYAAACYAGALCVELWEQFVATDPWVFDHYHYAENGRGIRTRYDHCRHCEALRSETEAGTHELKCLYERARSLLHGSPQP